MNAVRAFLDSHLFAHLPKESRLPLKDHKTELQEKVQQWNLGPLEYRTVEERGPAHDREFVVVVSVGEQALGEGTGRSKKEAEQQAASRALRQLQDHGAPGGVRTRHAKERER